MKTIIITVATAIVTLCSCTATSDMAATTIDTANVDLSTLRVLSDSDYCALSWSLYCQATGHDTAEKSGKAYTDDLDCWAGSTAEEEALIAAGVRP